MLVSVIWLCFKSLKPIPQEMEALIYLYVYSISSSRKQKEQKLQKLCGLYFSPASILVKYSFKIGCLRFFQAWVLAWWLCRAWCVFTTMSSLPGPSTTCSCPSVLCCHGAHVVTGGTQISALMWREKLAWQAMTRWLAIHLFWCTMHQTLSTILSWP